MHGALLHSPAGLAAAPWLLALQRWPILLQRPAVDFSGGARRLHGAQLHPPTGFAKTAVLLWRAAVLGWAGLRHLAGLRHALAGPLNVAAEAAGVMAGGQVRDADGAFVAAADGVVVAQILVILAFTVVHLVAEISKPSGIKSEKKKTMEFFLLLLLILLFIYLLPTSCSAQSNKKHFSILIG